MSLIEATAVVEGAQDVDRHDLGALVTLAGFFIGDGTGLQAMQPASSRVMAPFSFDFISPSVKLSHSVKQ